jgi:hypothetical protein
MFYGWFTIKLRHPFICNNIGEKDHIKGTVARDFRPLIFFFQKYPLEYLIHTLLFPNLVSNSWSYYIEWKFDSRCIMQRGVKSLLCIMQRGVKSMFFCRNLPLAWCSGESNLPPCILERVVEFYHCMMHRGVKLAAGSQIKSFGRLPRPLKELPAA